MSLADSVYLAGERRREEDGRVLKHRYDFRFFILADTW